MGKVEDLDIKLYGSLYDPCSADKPIDVWNEIKVDRDVLCKAIEVERDKWDEEDTVKAPCIVDCILDYPEQVDEDIYSMLVNIIYSNRDIARIFVGDSGKIFDTYLLKTLKNFDLNLNNDQKHYAIEETMNSNEHGKGAFDIRYWILRNPNWTIEEKEKLIYEFYDDEDYEKALDAWELDIVNDDANYGRMEELDKSMLYDYTMEDLVRIYFNGEIASRMMDEIKFCKMMRTIRPTGRDYFDMDKVNVKS